MLRRPLGGASTRPPPVPLCLCLQLLPLPQLRVHSACCRWVAVVGVVLALSRAFVIEAGTAFDPELAMMGE